MTEIKLGLLLIPETYEYDNEEIIFRIICNKQLLSERSLPKLEKNELLLETSIIDIEKIIDLRLVNIGRKKIKLKNFYINDEIYELEYKTEKFNFSNKNVILKFSYEQY